MQLIASSWYIQELKIVPIIVCVTPPHAKTKSLWNVIKPNVKKSIGTHDGGIFAVDNIVKLPAISFVYVILHMTTADDNSLPKI